MKKHIVNGFPNYSVTRDGIVYNGVYQLKHQLHNNGSPFVRLRKDGKYYTFSVAKLLALTFLGEPENDSDVVNYKDGNNHNIHVDNLFWSTRSDLFKNLYKGHNRYSELRLQNLKKSVSRPVASYEMKHGNLIKIKEYPSIAAAARELDVSSATISRCLKNPNGRAMNYYWRYLDE